MKENNLKSLDQFTEESFQFEEQFLELTETDADEASLNTLVNTIIPWLQECAVQGRFLPNGSADRRAFKSMLERWHSRLRGYAAGKGIDRLMDFDPQAGIVLEEACPYPGLEPYGEAHQATFFGREKLVATVIEQLERDGNRSFMLVGASGSGKSSTALAGILPRLQKSHDDSWLFGPVFTPGSNPLTALAGSVAQAIGQPQKAPDIEKRLAAEPAKAVEQLSTLCSDKPLMLLADQFEELFTLCNDIAKRQVFAKVLCALSDPYGVAKGFCCKLLLTLRTDQQARFEESNALVPLYKRLLGKDNDHIRNLSAIGFADIRQAIQKPAEQVGLRFIPESLIDQLASQTAGLANGLPLLQFCLRRLWYTRPTNEEGEPLDLVTEDMVKQLPDVERSLGTVADTVFQKFSEQQKKICERLFLELIVLDERYEEPLRRRRNEAELHEVLASLPGTADERTQVIDAFSREGLLRHFGEGQHSQVEVAHEALLRHWGHIYRLLMGAEVKERLHRIKQIQRQAREWVMHAQSNDYLTLKGEPLAKAQSDAREKWLADEEAKAYVGACTKQAEKKMELEQQIKSDQQFRKHVNRAILALIVLIFFGGYLWHDQKKKEESAIEKKRLKELAAAAQKSADIAESIGDGYYFLHENEGEKALASFNRAKDLSNGASQVAVELGKGFISLQGGEMNEENYKTARVHFSNVIEMTNNEKSDKRRQMLHTYYFNSGRASYGLKDFKAAIEAFEKAIKSLPTEKNNEITNSKQLFEYNYQLGLSYWKLGLENRKNSDSAISKPETASALYHFTRAEHILKNTNHNISEHLVEYHLYYGLSLLDNKQTKEAEEQFKLGVSLGSEAESANRFQLAKIFHGQRDTDNAIHHLKEAIAVAERLPQEEPLKTNLALYKVHLAQIYLHANNFENAIKWCREVVSEQSPDESRWLPNDIRGQAYNFLGTALSAEGKFNDAVAAFIEAENAMPTNAINILFLADAYKNNKNPEKAKESLVKAESLSKDDLQLKDEAAMKFFLEKMNKLKGELDS